MREYKEHYVAFLDILGFKELVTKNTCTDIFSIFDVLRSKTQRELTLNGVQINAYKHIHYTILSDSIIVYVDADIEDAFAALLDVCSGLQQSLANRDVPILMRGGIAKGDLFFENDIIYGEGLVKAYLLESKLAQFPRIVFSGNTLNDGRKNTKYMFTEMEGFLKTFQMDNDCLYYVDYLSICFFSIEDAIRYYDRLKLMCTCYLNKEIDSKLREKYLWLQNKIEKAIDGHVNIRDHYKKIKEEDDERMHNEYNARFEIFSKNDNQ